MCWGNSRNEIAAHCIQPCRSCLSTHLRCAHATASTDAVNTVAKLAEARLAVAVSSACATVGAGQAHASTTVNITLAAICDQIRAARGLQEGGRRVGALDQCTALNAPLPMHGSKDGAQEYRHTATAALACTTHRPLLQFLEPQSLDCLQDLPIGHAGQLDPPQSTSVSKPSLMPLVQELGCKKERW